MKFEWNENKAVINSAKHGVSFNEAETVFDDPLYVDFYDPHHSDNEARYLINGRQIGSRTFIDYLSRI